MEIYKISLIWIAAALSMTNSYAQSTPENNEIIIVKGLKEQKTLNQTQESLVVIKKQSLKMPIPNTGLEALQNEANITVNKEDETFTIRGVKNTGVTGYQKDNLASILVDRVFQTDLAIKSGSFNLYDLESLEILRGSQSLGQGINSLAGSLNLFHEDPKFDQSGNARVEVGNAGKKIINLKQNITLIEDKLALKISSTAQNYNGHIENKTTGKRDWAKKDQYNLNLDLLFFPNDQDQIKFGTKAFMSMHGGNYVHGPEPKNYEAFEDLNSIYRTKNSQTYLEYDKKINANWSNLAVIAYSLSKQQTSTDSDLTSQNLTGERPDYHRENFTSFENLLSFQNEKVKNTFGIHAHRFSLIDRYNFSITPQPNKLSLKLNMKQYVDRKRETLAAFNTFSIDHNDQFSYGLGGRYEYVDNKYDTNVIANRISSSGNAGIDSQWDAYATTRSGAYGGSNYENKFLPKASLLFHLSKDESREKNIGLTYSEGYRTGGVSINRSQTKAVTYKPETTQNYELSFKNNFSILRTGINIFYSNWRKQQVLVSFSQTDPYDSQVENASSSEFYGAESEILANLDDVNSINWNLGYVRTQFLKFATSSRSYNGNEFPSAPRVTSNLTHGFEFLDGHKLKTSIKYLGQSFADAENTKRIKEQYYIDMGLVKKYRNFNFEFLVKNILDKKYQINRYTNSYRTTYYQMSTPREYSMAINYDW